MDAAGVDHATFSPYPEHQIGPASPVLSVVLNIVTRRMDSGLCALFRAMAVSSSAAFLAHRDKNGARGGHPGHSHKTLEPKKPTACRVGARDRLQN